MRVSFACLLHPEENGIFQYYVNYWSRLRTELLLWFACASMD